MRKNPEILSGPKNIAPKDLYKMISCLSHTVINKKNCTQVIVFSCRTNNLYLKFKFIFLIIFVYLFDIFSQLLFQAS